MLRNTPIEALYALFKNDFGITHRTLSQIILSDRPFRNGISPQQMAVNTSWLSRSVVHAPMDSLQSRYFADFTSSAQRVHSLLLQSGHTDAQISATIAGSPLMPNALPRTDQSRFVYQNAVSRLSALPTGIESVRARTIVMLVITTGCTGNVADAIDRASSYLYADGRYVGRLTPSPTALGEPDQPLAKKPRDPERIALIRLIDGNVASNPYPVEPDEIGITIGSLALGERAIADVDPDVSAEHARVYRKEDHWYACDLDSKNCTHLLPSASEVEKALEPEIPAQIEPGDRLLLASSTVFVVVAFAGQHSWKAGV